MILLKHMPSRPANSGAQERGESRGHERPSPTIPRVRHTSEPSMGLPSTMHRIHSLEATYIPARIQQEHGTDEGLNVHHQIQLGAFSRTQPLLGAACISSIGRPRSRRLVSMSECATKVPDSTAPNPLRPGNPVHVCPGSVQVFGHKGHFRLKLLTNRKSVLSRLAPNFCSRCELRKKKELEWRLLQLRRGPQDRKITAQRARSPAKFAARFDKTN